MSRVLILSLAALGLAACASSSSPIVSKQNGMEAHRVSAIRSGHVDPEDNERICKSTPITGSRTMKRVCHTREEWAAMRRNAEDTVRGTQQHPTYHFENFGARDANSRVGSTAPGGGGG